MLYRDAPTPILTNSNSWNWSELVGIGIGIGLELVGIGIGIGRNWSGIGIFMQLENFEKPTIDSDSLTPKTFSQVL